MPGFEQDLARSAGSSTTPACRRFGLIALETHDSGDVYPETTPVQGSWQKSCSSQKKLNLFFCVACHVMRAFMLRQRFVYSTRGLLRSG